VALEVDRGSMVAVADTENTDSEDIEDIGDIGDIGDTGDTGVAVAAEADLAAFAWKAPLLANYASVAIML